MKRATLTIKNGSLAFLSSPQREWKGHPSRHPPTPLTGGLAVPQREAVVRRDEVDGVRRALAHPLAGRRVGYNTIQHDAIHYKTLHYTTIQYNTTHYNTIQDNTITYFEISPPGARTRGASRVPARARAGSSAGPPLPRRRATKHGSGPESGCSTPLAASPARHTDHGMHGERERISETPLEIREGSRGSW